MKVPTGVRLAIISLCALGMLFGMSVATQAAAPVIGISLQGPTAPGSDLSLTYTVTLTNSSVGIVSGTITHVFPTQLQFQSAQGASCSAAGDKVTCANVSLSPNTTHVVTLTFKAPTPVQCNLPLTHSTSYTYVGVSKECFIYPNPCIPAIVTSNTVTTKYVCQPTPTPVIPTPTPTPVIPTPTPRITPTPTPVIPTPTPTPHITPTPVIPTPTPSVPTPTPAIIIVNNIENINKNSNDSDTTVQTGKVVVTTGNQVTKVTTPAVAGTTTSIPVPITAKTGAGVLGLVATLLGGSGLSLSIRKLS